MLIGSCTHSRRYVDWEIKSSLRQGKDITPNGLIGILLPGMTTAHLPPRFKDNWNESGECYARYYVYPSNAHILAGWVEDAYNARNTRTYRIQNSQEMMKYNRECNVHRETH